MEKKLAEYYPVKHEEIWDSCLFVFDANVLLSLYWYPLEGRKSFFEILEKFRDRIWLPHQFAFEYQKNRLERISEQAAVYDRLSKCIGGIGSALCSNKHSFIDIGTLIFEIEAALKPFLAKIESQKGMHPDWIGVDPIRDEITRLFGGRVGDGFDAARMKAVHAEGEERYKKNMPPGYMDQKKEDNRFGDLIGWCQIIDHALVAKAPVVLVTEDRKEDWWWKHKGKTIGPRPELRREFLVKTKQGFHMYTMEEFMKYGGTSQTTIDKVNELRVKFEPIRDGAAETSTTGALASGTAADLIPNPEAATGEARTGLAAPNSAIAPE